MTGPVALGLDVGGTKISAALVDAGGNVLERNLTDTPAQKGPEAILNAAAELVETLGGSSRAAALGVGTAGTVDHERGVVTAATSNLPGWAGTDIAGGLRERLGIPALVDNDVNAMALGEGLSGAIRDVGDALYVAVGTGIGGAILHGAEVLRGETGTAGELGHLLVERSGGRRCSCGRYGHLEAYASGPGIARTYGEMTGETADLRAVAERARNREGDAKGAVAEGAALFGRALAGLVNALDPAAVVVGGGVAEIGELWWAPMEWALRSEALPGPSGVELRPARLGADAVVVGAALMALREGERGGRACASA